MKKYLTVFAAVLLLFSITACAKSSTGSSVPPASSEASSQGSSAADVSADPAQSSSGAESTGSNAVSSKAGGAFSKTPGASSAASNATVSNADDDSSVPEGRKTVRVTIPEGFTLVQIANRLEANGVCKKTDLMGAANSYDFTQNYPLVTAHLSHPNLYYKLEGYLFPNTYDFYVDMKPQDALGKMLRGSRDNIGSKYAYPGMTTDQIVTLASMIEKESGNVTEMKKVSAVFHNRLKTGMKLQSDVTRNYVNNYILDADINKYKYFYNTYRFAGLPAGPICNPGANALYAAAHPQTSAVTDTSTSFGFTPDATYFAADSKGNYYYATNYDQHKVNLAKGGIIEGGGMTQ